MSERGDVLRIRGDLDAAEAAYDERERLRLRAAAGSRAAVAGAGPHRDGRRARSAGCSPSVRTPSDAPGCSPPAVDVLLAADDADEASALADELDRVAADFGCAALRASADHAGAAVLLHRGDAPARPAAAAEGGAHLAGR